MAENKFTPQSVGQFVFGELRAMYGAAAHRRFEVGVTNQAGEDLGVLEAMAVWGRWLMRPDVTKNVVRDALRKCVDVNPKWAPTLPEFMALVLAEIRKRAARLEREAAACFEERQEGTPEARQAEFDAMRAILKAAQVPKRRPGRPIKAQPSQSSLLAGFDESTR
ncbi:hypothetical protein SAMN02787142_4323 [Burkholderia sp. WP9]|uniref:hypothetical protein n=1 Tax=Burkholderia sp. WP9 TaxID=1500263 RepID=UPI00089562FD|nr:hypothetical protein [Burkholderia sp. WP9]SEE00655.1 hypothetical protein SAMN02787142_4323 [Burkholderia sp. WP9]